MLAIRADANERRLADLYYREPEPFRLNRKTLIAGAAVVTLYGALGAYFAVQRWVLEPMTKFIDTKINVATYRQIIPDEPKPRPDQPPPPEITQPEPTLTQRPVDTPLPPPPDVTPTPLPPQVAPPPAVPVAVAALTPTPPAVSAVAKPAPLAMILNPDWIGKPTAAQANAAFPARAVRMGVSGHAELLCTVTASGSVSGCQVASETGAYGFGAAALSLSPYFKMKPRTVDGQAVEGAKVRIPVDFNLG